MDDVVSDGVYSEAFKNGIRPETRLSVSEWADRNRYLSEVSSAEPGQWRTSRVPYLREVMDVLSIYDPTSDIVFMKAAQVGGTECGLNWIGYIIDHAPAPMMLVQPTVETSKRNSKQRIAPMIEDSPALSKKVKPSRSRDSGNTVLQKDFPGGTLVLAGANSAVGLRSLPAKILFLDEVDAYPGDIDGEGDPITLASARQRTFSKRKKFLVSTPTVDGLSRIAPAYEASDKRKYQVPCPHCGGYQELVFKNLIFEKDKPEESRYLCSHCGVLIDEHYKTQMLDRGKWVKGNPASKIAGFHINSLYSPLGWYSWAQIAADWIEAQGKPEKLRGFINTVLGETWKDKGEVPDWERLYERRSDRPLNTVPKDGLLLTAGVDVQKDRLEVEIVAWGRELRSWSIDYRVIHGDTTLDEVWRDLDKILTETWPIEDRKGSLKIRKMGIDSGYNTQRVYSYVRSQDTTRVYATKGFENLTMAIGLPRAVDVNFRGKKIRRGVKLWPIGVSVLKPELYSWLRQGTAKDGESSPVGFCDFPQYEEEYFKMLTAEELVIRKVRGYSKPEWTKTRERNEALDCRVIARAMAALVGIDRFKDKNFEKLERFEKIEKTEKLDKPISTGHTKRDESHNETSRIRLKPRIKRRKSKWL